jgi:hypothetical protein
MHIFYVLCRTQGVMDVPWNRILKLKLQWQKCTEHSRYFVQVGEYVHILLTACDVSCTYFSIVCNNMDVIC